MNLYKDIPPLRIDWNLNRLGFSNRANQAAQQNAVDEAKDWAILRAYEMQRLTFPHEDGGARLKKLSMSAWEALASVSLSDLHFWLSLSSAMIL